jgi:RNA polymerase-binding transcription factor DksA
MDLDYFRDLLGRTRDDLVRTLEPIRARLREPQRDSGAEIAVADQHPAGAAADTEMRELDLSTEVLFEARLRDVADALRRLDEGTDGICAMCRTHIPVERLELVPETPYCVEDAAKLNA